MWNGTWLNTGTVVVEWNEKVLKSGITATKWIKAFQNLEQIA